MNIDERNEKRKRSCYIPDHDIPSFCVTSIPGQLQKEKEIGFFSATSM